MATREEIKEEENFDDDEADVGSEYEDLLELDDDIVAKPVNKTLFDSLPHAKFTAANA